MGDTKKKTIDLFGSCTQFFDGRVSLVDGTEKTNPVREAVTLEFKHEVICVRQGGCKAPDKSHKRRTRHSKYGCIQGNSTSNNPLDLLMGMMEEHVSTGDCTLETTVCVGDDEIKVLGADEIKIKCPGPVLNTEAREICWPHTVIFEYTPSCREKNIGTIQQSFTYDNKKFVLRGAILGDGNNVHWSACMKAGRHWLHYDGLREDNTSCPGGTFFRLFPIEDGDKAMNGYGLAYVIYEVLDSLCDEIDNPVDLSPLNIKMVEAEKQTHKERNLNAADIDRG
jgi:hypothetical protein